MPLAHTHKTGPKPSCPSAVSTPAICLCPIIPAAAYGAAPGAGYPQQQQQGSSQGSQTAASAAAYNPTAAANVAPGGWGTGGVELRAVAVWHRLHAGTGHSSQVPTRALW